VLTRLDTEHLATHAFLRALPRVPKPRPVGPAVLPLAA
jgi:hypothetical protein